MTAHATDNLCAVVLAAGAGTRLLPLTELLPKALCPVAGVPLIDRALGAVSVVAGDVAVNAHHHRELLVRHLDGSVHLSIEDPAPLGTAGAIGALRDWIGDRDVLVVNADTVQVTSLDQLVEGWDRTRVRLLVAPDARRADFRGLWRFAGASLLPGDVATGLRAQPSGLYEVCWAQREAAGALDLLPATGQVIDCGTPLEYLLANLVLSGGSSVIGEGARIDGEVIESVVWPGAHVAAGERLVHAIRLPDGRTVPARADVGAG